MEGIGSLEKVISSRCYLGGCGLFRQQFPTFHLEDKVTLEGECDVRPPIVHQYRRRGKSNPGIGIVRGRDHLGE